MPCTEFTFNIVPLSEAATDILASLLAPLGFHSFAETDTGLAAYTSESSLPVDALNKLIADFPLSVSIEYSSLPMEERNWNKEWEEHYFKPLVIDNRCMVQSTFHKRPATCDYNIYIDPKMAFGTGHHATTELMIRQMLDYDFTGKTVLDMGCGTAILAILASMRGAKKITAIDIDQWAYQNALENLTLNHISNVEALTGGAELLSDSTFNVILANINRNILLADMPAYVKVMEAGADLFLSGFFVEDIPMLTAKGEKLGLQYKYSTNIDNWAILKLCKL